MDAHTRKVYVPMTETSFYILLCLQKPNHGYGIVQMVEKMTEGEIRLAPGTMYGSLSKMENEKLIIKGRHDPCIVPRAVPVFEAAAAIAITDVLLDNTLETK